MFRFFYFLLIAGTLVYGTTAYAQSNYQPAVVVTIGGDTVKGFIDHKEWTRNPIRFFFKKAMSDPDPTVFGLAAISYAEVEDDAYVRYIGPISMDESSIRLADMPDFSETTDTVFLKVVTSGPYYQMTQYRDKLKARFYLSFRGQQPQELIYRYFSAQRDGRSGITEINKYRTQLVSAAGMVLGTVPEDLKGRIKRITYSVGSISDIVDRINAKNNAKALPAKSKNTGVIFFAGTGVSGVHVVFSPSDGSVQNASTPGPFANVGFDLLGNKDVGKLAFRAELSVSVNNLHFRADSLLTDFTTSQVTTSIAAQFVFNVYNSKKLKVYLSPGIRVSHSSYSNSRYNTTRGLKTTDNNEVPVYYSTVLQAGIILRQRLEINFSYVPEIGVLYTEFTPWKQGYNFTRVGVNWRFGSFK